VLLEIVDEAARRAHQHVAALAQLLALLVVVDAAVHGEDPQPGVAPEEARVGLDLHHQLAGGSDDEDARRGHAAPRRGGGAQAAGEGGDEEGGGLAGSGLRLPRHVLALERQRQRRFLDGGGGHKAGVPDALHHGLGEIEGRELEWAHEETSVGGGGGSEATSAGTGGTTFGARFPKIRAEMIPIS
jgi:hypothetical protein